MIICDIVSLGSDPVAVEFLSTRGETNTKLSGIDILSIMQSKVTMYRDEVDNKVYFSGTRCYVYLLISCWC